MTLSEFIEELRKLEVQGYGDTEVRYIVTDDKINRILVDTTPSQRRGNDDIWYGTERLVHVELSPIDPRIVIGTGVVIWEELILWDI